MKEIKNKIYSIVNVNDEWILLENKNIIMKCSSLIDIAQFLIKIEYDYCYPED